MWLALVDCLDALLVVVGSAVGKIISVDNGNHCMSQVHRFDRISEVGGFIGIQRRWCFDGTNRTETTSSGALLSCNHEGGITTGPAVVDVRAACLLTDGVQGVVFNSGLRAVENSLLFA